MKITRNTLETAVGSRELFTGAVYIDTVSSPSDGTRINASNVRFTPGARTAWHTHPRGQTVYVTDGVGRVGRRGAVATVHPGDRVFFEPGEDHWHGASPARFMSHLSLVEVDDSGTSATWGDHVTDEDYGGPAVDGE